MRFANARKDKKPRSPLLQWAFLQLMVLQLGTE
jgi:hypothetical protein